MIDASRLGFMIDSTHHSLSGEDIGKIAETYHNWIKKESCYKNIEGFCKVLTVDDLKKKNYVLAPNRFVKEKSIFNRAIKTNDLKDDLISSLKYAKLAELKLAQLKNNTFIHSMENYIKNNKPNDWEEVEVFQVIKEITGGEWGSEDFKEGYVECKVIRGTDFPNIPLYNLRKIPTRFIKQEKVNDKKLVAGDLLVEMSGGSKGQPTGRCAFISEYFLQSYDMPILYSNFCKCIRVNRDLIDPYWFYLYWMTAHREGLTTKYENQPSGIRNFQLDEFIASELILLPPIEEQIEITKIFNAMHETEQLSNLTSNKLKKIEQDLFYKIMSDNYGS
jgi:restriction endonuclease S subunit